MKWANQQYVFLLHLSFWVLFFVFKVFDYSNDIPTKVALTLVVCQHIFGLIGAYLHYFLLLPILISKKGIWIYILGLMTLLFICMIGRGWLESTFIANIFNTDYYEKWTLPRVLSMFWNFGSFIVFITLMKFTIDRFVLESQKKELENEKLNAELNYLKAQINPHFLFNTLHNLNYLSQIKSDQATVVILKLSNIMRYMIYDSNKPKVALSKELAYIQDYLDLESIRLNHSFDMSFDSSEVDEQIEIAPLILIPFVENAFKHGISDSQPQKWIKVVLKSGDGFLFINVENSIKPKEIRKDSTSGFGLKNLKRRLELSYPQKYQLTISQSVEVFSVQLKLEFA